MRRKILSIDIIIESILGLITIVIIGFMAFGLFCISILPLNNYHHAVGQIEFKRQYQVSSPNEGIITHIYVENNSPVARLQPILRYKSEFDSREVDALEVRIKFLKNELITLERLFKIGSVNKPEVEKKQLEIDEVMTRKHNLEKNTIDAPIDGKIYFRALPEYINGSFVKKGEVVAYIYTDDEKHIRISVPNAFIDRFSIGSVVLFKYKDPVSFRIQKMRGKVYKTFINEMENAIELLCYLTNEQQNLGMFQPFTRIDAAILINNSSILQDLFKIDTYPVFQKFIEQTDWYQKLLKVL
jgi:biotin carboxyl carrier protein